MYVAVAKATAQLLTHLSSSSEYPKAYIRGCDMTNYSSPEPLANFMAIPGVLLINQMQYSEITRQQKLSKQYLKFLVGGKNKLKMAAMKSAIMNSPHEKEDASYESSGDETCNIDIINLLTSSDEEEEADSSDEEDTKPPPTKKPRKSAPDVGWTFDLGNDSESDSESGSESETESLDSGTYQTEEDDNSEDLDFDSSSSSDDEPDYQGKGWFTSLACTTPFVFASIFVHAYRTNFKYITSKQIHVQ